MFTWRPIWWTYSIGMNLREFDIAYLVSGDADLAPAVDIVVSHGKQVINVYLEHPQRNSYALRGHCLGHFREITRAMAERFQWVPKKQPK